MTSRRLGILILVALGLAVLVWFDRSGGLESETEISLAGRDSAAPIVRTEAQPGGKSETDASRQEMRNPLASIRLDALTNTVKRPLFTAGRRPPAKPAAPRKRKPAAPPRPLVKSNHYKLLGVIGGGPRRIALLRDRRDGRHLRVEPGDQIDGWVVDRVDATEVALTFRDQKITLALHPN